jgi:biopolymer transport protein ExbB
MSMNQSINARSWAAKSLATLLAGFVMAISTPMLALAQAASEPASAPATSAPAAPAPADVKAPAAGAITEEAVDNPYGLKALWGQGDVVATAR